MTTARRKPKNRRYRPSAPSLVHSVIRRLPRPRVEIDRGLAWYVVWTAARAEHRVQCRLAEGGLPTYVPSEAVTVVRRGRLEEAERPAISRYLFVGLSAAQPEFAGVAAALEDWFGIPRLGRILRTDQGPLRVPASAIQALADGLCVFEAPTHPFAPGSRVRPRQGPWQGFLAEVERADDYRVRALIDLFGRRTRVEFDPAQLEAA